MFLKKFFRKLKKDKKTIQSRKVYDTSLKPLDFFKGNVIGFQSSDKPLVSIIIPVYGQIQYTLNCLLTIMEDHDGIEKEIIVVNDKSPDDTLDFLNRIKRIKIIDNTENLGFLKSVNKGIESASGKYVYLLNNDTKVQKNYLKSLLKIFEEKEGTGAVGSKMIFANQHLQEAGCLLFEDQTVVNLGATKSPDAPKFNFVREVDYCSGCSLLFSRISENGSVNLLDERYSPAYYEETDLCMRLKNEQKLKIYYQPESEVVHFENVSYSTKSEGKQLLIDRNSKTFWDKWNPFITNKRTVKVEGNEFFNENAGYEKGILILEEYMPKFDQDSGSNRFTEIVKILLKNNFRIYLAIMDLKPEADKRYVEIFQQMGIEVIREFVTPQKRIVRIEKQLKEIKHLVDFVWIFRPQGYIYWTDILKKLKFRKPVIYDMVDLHYLRFNRENEFIKKRRKTLKKEQSIMQFEQKALRESDAIAAISETEKSIIEKNGIKAAKNFVVSNIHQIKNNLPNISFEDRKGIMFIGGFHHKPNVDAVLYLKNEIMPLVWKENPNIEVSVIGGDLPEEIKKLDEEKFRILGYQKEVDYWFHNSRIFVAPLRYGAGVKGKIGQALEYELPVVSTPIGVEGMKLKDRENALVAKTESPEDFAEKILELYGNKELWEHLHRNSESGLEPFSVKTQEKNILEMLNYLSQ